MLDRIIGIITLQAKTYREVADDKTATPQAAIIVIVAQLIAGFFSGLIQVNRVGNIGISLVGAIVTAVVMVIVGLVAWFVAAWVLAFVAKAFGGKTDTSEMLRVTGYVDVFTIIAVLNVLALVSPVLLCIAGIMQLLVAILHLVGYVIGVREAAEFSTGNAIVTAVIAAIINFIIVAVVGGAILGTLAVAGALAR